jgi:hypothetical protein
LGVGSWDYFYGDVFIFNHRIRQNKTGTEKDKRMKEKIQNYEVFSFHFLLCLFL